MDYDVFLFSRVTEFRMLGYSTDASIRNGYYHTGSIITGAGIVMAVAFSGLFSASVTILQQMGFFLCLSVLLDTFVIRGILVPALLHFIGDFNWWPVILPPGNIDEFGQPIPPKQNWRAPAVEGCELDERSLKTVSALSNSV